MLGAVHQTRGSTRPDFGNFVEAGIALAAVAVEIAGWDSRCCIVAAADIVPAGCVCCRLPWQYLFWVNACSRKTSTYVSDLRFTA